MSFCNFLCNGIPLVAFVQINFVVFVFTCYRFVGRNNNDIQVVNLTEFNCFGCSGTGHARQLVVHAEKVLESNGCKRAVSLCNADMLFCFDSLMQTVTVAATFKNTSGKFINNLNCTVFYDIVYIVVVQYVCTDCLCKVVNKLKVLFVENSCVSGNKVMLVQNVVDFVHTLVGERYAF